MELEHKKDYNPSALSAQISCKNMALLSEADMHRQNHIFMSHFDYNECEKYHNFQPQIDDIKKRESELLKGYSINKKSCIYKRPLYTEGKWQNRFDSHLQDRDDLFVYQTKAKTKDNIIECDYSTMTIPDNFYKNITCDDDRLFVYTKTFTNDYYSCLI